MNFITLKDIGLIAAKSREGGRFKKFFGYVLDFKYMTV